MSPIAAGMDGLLALLLVLALALGLKLNTRLKTLRESQAGFAAAVIELNQAAARAEAGLSALKAASESAHDDLLTRIETARGLIGRLERAGGDAQRILQTTPDRSQPAPRAPGAGNSLAAIAALAETRLSDRSADRASDRGSEFPAASEASRLAGGPLRAPLGVPRKPARAAFDEDLFETKSRDRGELGPLRPPRGDR